MIVYANAKINIGLFVTYKRNDGFHNIETVFYPLPLYDIIEFREAKEFSLTTEGISLDIPVEDNLIYKIYSFFSREYGIQPVEVFMIKRIPHGAGLGGGSADLTFFAKGLNDFFGLGLSVGELKSIVAGFGSDCPFFVDNMPVFAYGKGSEFKPVSLDLSRFGVVVVKPEVSISTPAAYKSITPKEPDVSLLEIVEKYKLQDWKSLVKNDFEAYAFSIYPELHEIKNRLRAEGAIFALMTGSGSAVYGIFENKTAAKRAKSAFEEYFVWAGEFNLI